jgi:hypothetical protein
MACFVLFLPRILYRMEADDDPAQTPDLEVAEATLFMK